MARDVNLKLADGASPISTTAALAAINTEGGFWADVRLFIGTVTDADETINLTVEISKNGGSNYYHAAEFPTLLGTQDGIQIARGVYIPRPAVGQTVTKVRLKARAVGGTTPSFPITAWIEPHVSLAPPATDEALAEGVALLA